MAKVYTKKRAYGQSQPLIDIFNAPVSALRDANNNDRYEVGQVWINRTTNAIWMLTSYAAGNPVWTRIDDAGATGITWETNATNAVALAANHGYFLTAVAGAIVCTLPAVAALGTEIWLIGDDLSAVGCNISIAINGAQVIAINHLANGAAGLRTNTRNERQSIHIICTAANTDFTIVSSTSTLEAY